MEIKRINSYTDPRFSPEVLRQHGGFLIGDHSGAEMPYEVKIISCDSAVVYGENPNFFEELIEEFRFYAPQITKFYSKDNSPLLILPDAERIRVKLDDIQPSQFFVDRDKADALRGFIKCGDDIVLQILRSGGKTISLDGHTRLYLACEMGFDSVLAVESESDSYIFDFVAEANRRGIFTPRDLILLPHDEYEVKWNAYCDEFFRERENTAQ
ncbi:MAG: hypothetical protein ACI4XJ_00520 [Eubacteriales bacterium]